MITSVRFCLSYDILNAIFSPSKVVYFHENLHCCNGRRHDVTCSHRKCYVTCGHNIIYDMTLSTIGINMFFYAFTSAGPWGKCSNPSLIGEGFNYPEGSSRC